MIAAIKLFLRSLILPGLAIGGIVVFLVSIFYAAEWGLYLVTFLVPQPNVWHKLYSLPFGKDIIDALVGACLLGILVQKKGFSRTGNAAVICVFILSAYISVWISADRYGLPPPVSLSNPFLADFKNYAEMVILYFLAANAIKNERQQKVLLAVMAVAFLLISTRSYRNFVAGDIFNWSQREVGPFWAVGLNANHFGAFICHYWSAFLGLYFFVKDKWIKRLLLGNVLIGIYPLLFSYSRGAYLGALASLTLIGLLKKRILLIFSPGHGR